MSHEHLLGLVQSCLAILTCPCRCSTPKVGPFLLECSLLLPVSLVSLATLYKLSFDPLVLESLGASWPHLCIVSRTQQSHIFMGQSRANDT